MAKTEWKPGNMLYPLPAVLVGSRDEDGKDNLFTAAWAGTINTNPPMVSISIRKSRLSYDMIIKSGEFVINITTEKLAYATDWCGVKSGRDFDKYKEMKLHKEEASHVNCAMIKESPVNLECVVTETKDLGSHTIFLADVVAVHIDDQYLDENGRFDFNAAKPIVYSHGEYYGLGQYIGSFGWSVKKGQKRPADSDTTRGRNIKADKEKKVPKKNVGNQAVKTPGTNAVSETAKFPKINAGSKSAKALRKNAGSEGVKVSKKNIGNGVKKEQNRKAGKGMKTGQKKRKPKER